LAQGTFSSNVSVSVRMGQKVDGAMGVDTLSNPDDEYMASCIQCND